MTWAGKMLAIWDRNIMKHLTSINWQKVGCIFTQAYAIAANCASIRSSLLSRQLCIAMVFLQLEIRTGGMPGNAGW